MTPDAIIEAVGQAFADEVARLEGFPPEPISSQTPEYLDKFLRATRVAISAMLDAIAEPTPEMVRIAYMKTIHGIVRAPNDPAQHWAAMISTLSASMKEGDRG